jgi:hypothetical protein
MTGRQKFLHSVVLQSETITKKTIIKTTETMKTSNKTFSNQSLFIINNLKRTIMKTKNLFLVCLLGATLIMLSCQKDAGLTPEATVEQSMVITKTSIPGLESSLEDPSPYQDILSNYPDPFYTLTNIKFVISKTSEVTLSVRNMKSGLSEKLLHTTVNKGVYYIVFGANKPAGKYEAILKVDGRSYREIMTKKSKWDPEPVHDDVD